MTYENLPTAATFTGEVQARVVRAPDAGSALAVYEVTFAAAARTYWHTHPRGQSLYVTAGRARIQIDGLPAAEYRAGEYVWISPGARHWHGAAPDTSMTHIAAQEAAPDGRTVTWAEPVDDATYQNLNDFDNEDHR